WPILALSIAVNVFGLTRLIQGADFFNIQKEVYFLSTSPLPTLQPRPKRFLDIASAADLARWRSPFAGLTDPTVWRNLPSFRLNPELLARPPMSLVQARAAMSGRAGEMTAIRQTLTDRAQALQRSREEADKQLKELSHVSLRDQEARLVTSEADAR